MINKKKFFSIILVLILIGLVITGIYYVITNKKNSKDNKSLKTKSTKTFTKALKLISRKEKNLGDINCGGGAHCGTDETCCPNESGYGCTNPCEYGPPTCCSPASNTYCCPQEGGWQKYCVYDKKNKQMTCQD